MGASLTNRLKLLRDFLSRRATVSGQPIDLTVETTTKCNLRCPMCTREQLIPDVQDMNLDLFKRVIDQGRDHLEIVAPMFLGEPLMNPHIFEMIRYCKARGLRVVLSTNGTILDRRTAESLLESGVDYLIFSFDGASRETYEKYRLGASFEKTRDSILRFLKLKAERGAPIRCVIQMVVLKDNAAELEEFKRLWDVDGVDELRFKPNMVLEGDFAIPRPLANPAIKGKPCFHLWRSNLVVRYDGVVFPCCWSYGALPVGDLRRQTLDQVWNSDEMVRLRSLHAQGRGAEIPACRDCSLVQPGRLALLGAFLLDGYWVRRLLPLKEKAGNLLEKIRRRAGAKEARCNGAH